MTRKILLSALVVIGAVSLVAVGAAGGAAADNGNGKGKAKGKPSKSATPVFKLRLKPNQEVPPVKNLKADAVGHVTFDLERSSSGAITSGEVIFYFNYAFPGSVTVSGLHVHSGPKNDNGPIVIDSGGGSFTDTDGQGNVTRVVVGVSPTVLQAILDNPRGYYVNLHTSVNPSGALRAQLHNPKKR